MLVKDEVNASLISRSDHANDLAASPQGVRRWAYLSVPAKFTLALAVAIMWTALSVWLSQRWVADLAAVTSWAFAVISIAFIAYVPGFMNAFLVATLSFDRRPPARAVDGPMPGMTVLVAAYNESAGIGDTLKSLAEQDYAGLLEVLVLNDGSKDDTAFIVRELLKSINAPANISFTLFDFPLNRGKSAVLNDGLRTAAHELVVTIDGDCWMRANALTQMARRYLSDPANTAAVAGAVMVRNSRQNLLTRAQEWD